MAFFSILKKRLEEFFNRSSEQAPKPRVFRIPIKRRNDPTPTPTEKPSITTPSSTSSPTLDNPIQRTRRIRVRARSNYNNSIIDRALQMKGGA